MADQSKHIEEHAEPGPSDAEPGPSDAEQQVTPDPNVDGRLRAAAIRSRARSRSKPPETADRIKILLNHIEFYTRELN